MLRDVNTTVTDGGLGISVTSGIGSHVKIGASHVTDAMVTIVAGMSAKRIKYLLGESPLADACMDSLENGAAVIYCLPVDASTAGTSSAIEKLGTGLSTATISGSPYNDFEIDLVVTVSGRLNEAALKYSINGSLSYSDEVTIPLNGEVVLAGTGLKVTFTEDVGTPANSFLVGDKYSFSTTTPIMTNQDVLDKLDVLKTLDLVYEYVHIVGGTTKALWASIAAEADTFTNVLKKPTMFILEARAKNTEETLEEYVDALIDEQKTVTHTDLQVVTARSIYKKMDGVVKEINNASIVCGLYSAATVSQSIGEVKSFSISDTKMISLMPLGIGEYLDLLDQARYLTFRKYEGIAGCYVTNAKMLAADDSDYKYAERVRVKNKMLKETRKQALYELQSEIDMVDPQGSLDVIAKFVQIPLDEMVRNKEVSSARIFVPEGQDILSTEKLNMVIRFIPKGHVREMELDLGMENPFNV